MNNRPVRRLVVAVLLATTAGAGVMADVDGVPNAWQASWLTCVVAAAGVAGWLTGATGGQKKSERLTDRQKENTLKTRNMEKRFLSWRGWVDASNFAFLAWASRSEIAEAT